MASLFQWHVQRCSSLTLVDEREEGKTRRTRRTARGGAHRGLGLRLRRACCTSWWATAGERDSQRQSRSAGRTLIASSSLSLMARNALCDCTSQCHRGHGKRGPIRHSSAFTQQVWRLVARPAAAAVAAGPGCQSSEAACVSCPPPLGASPARGARPGACRWACLAPGRRCRSR